MDPQAPHPVIAIMQPYLLPYIGYFQLIAQSDIFVVYDDSQYIKNGWSNRNRLLLKGEPHVFTIPVAEGAHEASYGERRYLLTDRARSKLLRTFEQSYAKAPCFAATMALLNEILAFDDLCVAAFNQNALERVCGHLGLATPIVRSSSLPVERVLSGQDRVIAICRALGARAYLNSSGGIDLYDGTVFAAAGIGLMFNAPDAIEYDQFGAKPVAGLSIVDAMMFNPVEAIRPMLYRSRMLAPRQAA